MIDVHVKRRRNIVKKDAENLMRIKKLSEETGVPRGTIKFYIKEGLIPRPIKTQLNMAYYNEKHLDAIRLVKELQSKRFLPLSIIKQIVSDLPAGAVRVEIGELPAGRTALGYVEGWRGEIYHWIRTAPGNRLARCKVKDPSLQNWPALSEAIMGNIVPDFPVVNKSFNLSYSGTDR